VRHSSLFRSSPIYIIEKPVLETNVHPTLAARALLDDCPRTNGAFLDRAPRSNRLPAYAFDPFTAGAGLLEQRAGCAISP